MKTAAGLWLLAVAVSGAAVAVVVRAAVHEREQGEAVRCGAGLVAKRGLCCAPGQNVQHGHCAGFPTLCPPGMHFAELRKGCVADTHRVDFAGGKLWVGAEDWQADGVAMPRAMTIAPFGLDSVEVTAERWEHCVRAGACRELGEMEPGAPVTRVEPKEAERFCRFDKGRLPTGDEWLFAAAGAEGRRFPWGSTGLVCRRAAFGLLKGPCAFTGAPDLVGSHPEGATPEGVLDLAGNVSEWTLDPNGQHAAHGGSYRSDTALELKSWATENAPLRAPYVGFRCAYDPPGPAPFH